MHAGRLTLLALMFLMSGAEDPTTAHKLNAPTKEDRTSTMIPTPPSRFIVDEPKAFVNTPSKTTVGYAPKYTSNRKFFANLLANYAFKEMLQKDVDALWKDLGKKAKYCEDIVMDQDIHKELYGKEVDQNKI